MARVVNQELYLDVIDSLSLGGMTLGGLAKDTGRVRGSIRHCLERLQACGLVEMERKPLKGPGLNRYGPPRVWSLTPSCLQYWLKRSLWLIWAALGEWTPPYRPKGKRALQGPHKTK